MWKLPCHFWIAIMSEWLKSYQLPIFNTLYYTISLCEKIFWRLAQAQCRRYKVWYTPWGSKPLHLQIELFKSLQINWHRGLLLLKCSVLLYPLQRYSCVKLMHISRHHYCTQTTFQFSQSTINLKQFCLTQAMSKRRLLTSQDDHTKLSDPSSNLAPPTSRGGSIQHDRCA